MGVAVTGPLETKFANDVYPTHKQELTHGGYRSVASISELHAIPTERRRMLMMVAVRNYGGEPGLVWLDTADNTPAQLSDNDNWQPVSMGDEIDSALTFRGFVDMTDGSTSDGFTISDNPVTPPEMTNGWFWIVEVAGTYDFGSGNITASINDWIVYDGTYLRKLSQTSVASWNTLSDRPQILLDIVSGSVVYGTQTWVNSQISTSETNTQNWVVSNYYDKDYIDNLVISGGGGSTTFIGLTDVPGSFSGQGGRLVAVNTGATALEFIEDDIYWHSSGATTLTTPTLTGDLTFISSSFERRNATYSYTDKYESSTNGMVDFTYAWTHDFVTFAGITLDPGGDLGPAGVIISGSNAAKYEDDYSTQFGLRSLPDVAFTNTKVAGKTASSVVQNPTSNEDGYAITWNDASGNYTLGQITNAWMLSGTSSLTGTTVIETITNNVDLEFRNTGNGLDTGKSYIKLWDGNGIQLETYELSDSESTVLDFYDGWIHVDSDVSGFPGIIYLQDNSASFADGSLVNKKWVVDNYSTIAYADSTIAGYDASSNLIGAGPTQDGYSLTYNDTTGEIQLSDITGGGGSGTPGGATNSIQYKVDNTTFGGFGSLVGGKFTISGDLQLSSDTTAKNFYFTSDQTIYLTTESTGTKLVLKANPSGSSFHVDVQDFAYNSGTVVHGLAVTIDSTSWISGSMVGLGMNMTTTGATDSKFIQLFSDGTYKYKFWNDGRISFKSTTTPTAPAAGYVEFYFDSADGDKPKVRTSTGLFNLIGVDWGNIAGTLASQTDLQTALDAKEATFSKNTGFNKNFGTTAGTVSEGNHTHASYLTDAPSDGSEYLRKDGAWVVASGGSGLPAGTGAEVQYRVDGSTFGASGLTYDSANTRMGWGTTAPAFGWHYQMETGTTYQDGWFLGDSTGTYGILQYVNVSGQYTPTTHVYVGPDHTTDTYDFTVQIADADDIAGKEIRREWFRTTSGTVANRAMWIWTNHATTMFRLNPTNAEWFVPNRVAGYTAVGLPTASNHANGVVYVTDEGLIAVSNGTDWIKLGIVTGTTLTNGSNVTLDCDNQQSFRCTWSTTSTASYLELDKFDMNAHVTVKKTDASDKTVTIRSLTSGYKFINMQDTKALPAAEVAITVTGAANIPTEIHLYDSGYLDSTDKVVHILYR
ncbi:MAG: hypothetical protein ACXABY_04520 [Candidatus Thorarchaeota archaeon]|jgi:hypothetical protein